ncbi:MAG: hypothetical protein IJW06_06410, partial [Clostridia bacterium]|nr:hypothetical protein [Clostridia bacterium]
MLNIKPKTYNEAVRLSGCLEIKKYIPNLPDEKIEEMYNFLSQNEKNKISVTPEMVSFINASGETESAMVIEAPSTVALSFDHIILGAAAYNVMHRPTSNSSGCGSSCGGCSTNNNNN